PGPWAPRSPAASARRWWASASPPCPHRTAWPSAAGERGHERETPSRRASGADEEAWLRAPRLCLHRSGPADDAELPALTVGARGPADADGGGRSRGRRRRAQTAAAQERGDREAPGRDRGEVAEVAGGGAHRGEQHPLVPRDPVHEHPAGEVPHRDRGEGEALEVGVGRLLLPALR